MVATRAGVRRVDDDGLALWGFGDRAVDVLFDGRRVWSFWLERDTRTTLPGVRSIEWPSALRKFLDGQTRLTVTEHVSGRVLYDQERAFGTADTRIEIVGRSGAPISLDKSNRISPTFDTRSRADVLPLLTAISTVLDAIASAGIDAFLAYGTLLGAIREQKFLGHDSDADLAYVSAHSHPADVVRESFRLQRAVQERGFHTYRYSGAAFRIDVKEGDGVVRGLDVFAGFIDDGVPLPDGRDRRRLPARVGLPRDAPAPSRGNVPGPGRPRALARGVVRADAGRCPTRPSSSRLSDRTVRQLSGWFRGTSTNRAAWERAYSGARGRLPTGKPSPLARKAAAYLSSGGTVIDLGAGRGADSLWLARQGLSVRAYDYVPSAAQAVQQAAMDEDLDLDVRMLNLNEWRTVLAEGARMARVDGPRVMIARHTADATNRFGRQALARFASMSLRGGGRLFLDVWTGPGRTPDRLKPVPIDEVARELSAQGARILVTRERPARAGSQRSSRGRLVAQWD